jgi:membrane protease YdiL (CAAX protease family)
VSERHAWLALVSVAATAVFYALPGRLQHVAAIQFVPQALAYLGMALWASQNCGVTERLGLARSGGNRGLRWGLLIGLLLGCLNVTVILWLVPWLGHDISFLRTTPHARVPTAAMLPWLIILIATAIELNFRGFLLGRLLALHAGISPRGQARMGPVVAVGASALVFAFDPFMVMTFKHLHWIAVWDGIVWGLLWLRLRNLYAPIAAHAVEVIVLYSIIKHTLA